MAPKDIPYERICLFHLKGAGAFTPSGGDAGKFTSFLFAYLVLEVNMIAIRASSATIPHETDTGELRALEKKNASLRSRAFMTDTVRRGVAHGRRSCPNQVRGYPQEASEEDQTCAVKTPGSTQRYLGEGSLVIKSRVSVCAARPCARARR
ncbi:hypothetical protein BGY98DRAFT_512498 [Russula aff. rugulosa BPL654]|nr:hypothetical protein BGY98DRAFT_512498 [Russula aff. rugulosa BPL654]